MKNDNEKQNIGFIKEKGRPWANVALFENVSDGKMLEMDLKNKGFETRTYNDALLQLFLFLCPPHATYRVQVRGNDFKYHSYSRNPETDRTPAQDHFRGMRSVTVVPLPAAL